MNNTQEEAVSTLLGWAEEDEETRGLLIITDDEDCIRSVYNGTERSLVTALAVAMRGDKVLRSVCANALFMYEQDKAKHNDEE